jgi:spermidine/putrescine transport system substrate-binding protein
MDLLQPNDELCGKVAMMRDSRDLIGMALKALGHSANSTDPADHVAAESILAAQKPCVATYELATLNEASDLVSGKVWAAMFYNGDALQTRQHDANIKFILPREGGHVWIDYLVVLATSPNKAAAMEFLNFLNRPENAARQAQYAFYATPNKAAEALLPEEFLTDPVINPDASALAKSEISGRLPSSIHRLRNQIFANITR